MTITDDTRPAATGGATTRRATRHDRADVNRVLASAFRDDPVYQWIVPDRAARERMLEPSFDAFVEAFAHHDETHVVTGAGTDPGHDSVAGVALWAPPGVPTVRPEDEETLGLRIGTVAGEYVDRFLTCLELFEAVHPHEPAWYLQFLGVDDRHQGTGIGSTLLRGVLERADAAGEAAYLEATSLRNRALYERHGFVCIDEVILPDGPTAYPMWREPRT